MKDAEATPWKGLTLSEQQARRILLDAGNQSLWSEHRITIGSDRTDYQVMVDGKLMHCQSWRDWD
jgi:hypothetical protein